MQIHLEPRWQQLWQYPHPVAFSSSSSRATAGRPISLPRLGGSASRPEVTSWTKMAQLDKLRPDRSDGKPPGEGTLSLGGGMTRREQALRAWICAGLSYCKGARKALMYLLAPSMVSNAWGKDSTRESSPECSCTYSHLQQPRHALTHCQR